MPTDLFVRRPLLWLQIGGEEAGDAHLLPEFRLPAFPQGARRPPARGRRSVLRCARSTTAPSPSRCRSATSSCRRSRTPASAQERHVSGLRAGGSLSRRRVSRARHAITAGFAPTGTSSGVGSAIEVNPADARDVIELDVRRAERCPTWSCASRTMRARRSPTGHVGHILIRGPNVTQGYFGDPEATALALDADGWLDTGDLGVMHEGELYIAGRSKEIIFVNGQNYYPYDLENIAQRAPGLDLNKVVDRGRRETRRTGRGAGGVRAAPRRRSQEFLPHGRRRQPPDQRAHRHRGCASDPGQADPQDHQRQGAAASAREGLYRRRVRRRISRSSRRCAHAHGGLARVRLGARGRACRRSAKRRCPASASR